MAAHRRGCRIAALLVLAWGATAGPAQEPRRGAEKLPPPGPANTHPPAAPAGSILTDPVNPIDLGTALRLAGVQNPEILLARERVVEAVALRQLAAAQFLPTLNGGTNFDSHTGPL